MLCRLTIVPPMYSSTWRLSSILGVKNPLQRVNGIFLFFNKNICCGYSLEAHWGGASKYPLCTFLLRSKKTISSFWTELLDLRIDY